MNNPIQLLESPISTTTTTAPSQKASSGDISGTMRGIIDPLVSKQPEKTLNEKNLKKKQKQIKKKAGGKSETKTSLVSGHSFHNDEIEK